MLVPEDVREVLLGRDCGLLWLETVDPDPGWSYDSVAVAAGLRPLGGLWTELDRAEAETFLARLLHRSVAYGTELVPLPEARACARGFLACVGGREGRFGTNLGPQYGSDEPRRRWRRTSKDEATDPVEQRVLRNGTSWTPMTDHTFDLGIVAIGDRGAAMYWVAEED